MSDGVVVLVIALLVSLTSVGIVAATGRKSVKHRDEIRYGSIGGLFFAFIAWACIYMAQSKPFVDPSGSKDK